MLTDARPLFRSNLGRRSARCFTTSLLLSFTALALGGSFPLALRGSFTLLRPFTLLRSLPLLGRSFPLASLLGAFPLLGCPFPLALLLLSRAFPLLSASLLLARPFTLGGSFPLLLGLASLALLSLGLLRLRGSKRAGQQGRSRSRNHE